MVNLINVIACIRIFCYFNSDIFRIAEIIGEQKDIRVIAVKDYITYPKASGYKSYHMIVTVPVYLSDRIVDTKVEVQIRTVAMDFWATLEHDLYYKKGTNAPQAMISALTECAEDIANIDRRMQFIKNQVDDLDNNP